MTSIIDRSLPFGPGFDTHPTFDSVADPTLLSDPLTSFFDGAFFQLSSPCQTSSIGTGDDFTAQSSGSTSLDTLDTDILVDAGSNSARRYSLFPSESDDQQLDTASQKTKSPQTTSDSRELPESGSKPKSPRTSTKRRRGATANTAEARANREVNLEKNRQAANRCRKKKRDWMDRLEDKHRTLSAHNKLLRVELAGLNTTVYALKELVLRHADCGSCPIDEYVRREAEQVQVRVRGSLTPSVLALPNL